jgi:COMPASS component SWD3
MAVSSTKKRPLDSTMDTDDNENNENDDNDDASANNNNKNPYVNLSVYGEHKRAVSSVALAPSRLTKYNADNILAASASADGSCKIWDLQDGFTGDRRLIPAAATCVGHSRGINDVCWNPLSPLLATASDDKTVRLWDAVTAECMVEFRGHDNFVFCVDQCSSMVVSGSFDETVKLWDVRSGDCVSTLPAHSDPVTAVSFNRDGTTVSSASHDGLIRIWDVATGECLKTIYAAGNPPVSSVKYSPNSKYLLAGTLDSAIRLWPVTVVTGSNTAAKTYQGHHVNTKYSVTSAFTADGNVVTGCETGKIVLYNLQTCGVQQVLGGHEDAVLTVAAHDTHPLICSGGMTADRRVEFWGRKDYVQAVISSSSGSSAVAVTTISSAASVTGSSAVTGKEKKESFH